ncbi:uncharacterized protein TNCV_1367121 [Trichonephila clavipes]|nr:uncharacterized protein TNCV_1367121 [Trichonephila clavipes]
MPPNTLRVHTEYGLVKSVGPKILWAESREQGDWRIFTSPFSFISKLWRWRSVVSPSIVPLGNFAELIRTVTCMVLTRPTTGVLLDPYHDEFRGPRSDYVRQVALATTTYPTTPKERQGDFFCGKNKKE